MGEAVGESVGLLDGDAVDGCEVGSCDGEAVVGKGVGAKVVGDKVGLLDGDAVDGILDGVDVDPVGEPVSRATAGAAVVGSVLPIFELFLFFAKNGAGVGLTVRVAVGLPVFELLF